MSNTNIHTSQSMRDAAISVLKSIFDPEIPVDIYELGLIYEVNVKEDTMETEVIMTLTSPACPVAGSLPQEVEDKIASIKGIGKVTVELVFDPPWDQDMMSEEAMLELGLM